MSGEIYLRPQQKPYKLKGQALTSVFGVSSDDADRLRPRNVEYNFLNLKRL